MKPLTAESRNIFSAGLGSPALRQARMPAVTPLPRRRPAISISEFGFNPRSVAPARPAGSIPRSIENRGAVPVNLHWVRAVGISDITPRTGKAAGLLEDSGGPGQLDRVAVHANSEAGDQ